MFNDHDTALLRSELFSLEQLKCHAIGLAKYYKIDFNSGPDKLLPRLADNEKVLRAAYLVVTSSTSPSVRLIPAESWLLDNFYLIEQQITLARRHLPLGYSKQLPRLSNGSSAGFPRIYDLALELISHMDGRIDIDNVNHIITAYQTVEPLKLGELWAFPIMLQLALLENLRRVALRIANRREEREIAIEWADKMLLTAEKEPKKLIQLLAEFANADIALTAPFVEEFYAKLQAQGPAMTFVQTWVEQKLVEQGITATQLSESASRTAANNQISIANSVSSLRFIDAMDWQDYVESQSMVEQTLRLDPAGMYAVQDFSTRDRYRHVIEDLARGSSQSEVAVATQVIALAGANLSTGSPLLFKPIEASNEVPSQVLSSERNTHVGYYLIDRGRQALEEKLGYHLSWKLKAKRVCNRLRFPFYLGALWFVTFLSIIALYFLGDFQLNRLNLSIFNINHWHYWIFAIAVVISFSSLAVSLVNLIATLILPPRILPRLDFSKGIPACHRTMVIVPTLISTTSEIDHLIEALEIRYLGNQDKNLFFALLTDYRDADSCVQAGDFELLGYAKSAIHQLNERYSSDRRCIFYLFHRPRIWNEYEQLWMGYERKRGKIEQFNMLLQDGNQSGFVEVVGDFSILSSIKYVITLDTDTQLPRDTARILVGNMAHPLNRPIYDAEKKRIVDGYAILQPRASVSLLSAGQSRFTKLFAGEFGIDPYTREVSDVYQDIFGEGSFIGKGIYDVSAFRQVIDGRFPENIILSHDLLEGTYARSALVTDVNLIEDYPISYTMDASRRHRWIRGDWQLAGWLLPSVPSPLRDSNNSEITQPLKREINPISALSVWKIFDNLRRSLVAPAMLFMLLCGWIYIAFSSPSFDSHTTWFWTLLVLFILLLPNMLHALIGYFQKPSECGWKTHLISTSKVFSRSVLLALLTIALLPYDAWICLDAIKCSGIRMLFTKRGLLLWHTPAYSKRNARSTLVDFYLEMWAGPILALLLSLILAFSSPKTLLSCAPIILLWVVSPFVGWWISKPLITSEQKLSNDQRLFLRATARRTWRFFSTFVGENDHWLAPDNFQEYPSAVIASRTSPTNIGLSLLANLTAYDFGYITARELLVLTEKTFATMDKLERYQGHFYNWYDTNSLQTLYPQYVSSVDSGNLAGCLIALKAGLTELKTQPVFSSNAFQGLQDTLLALNEHLPTSVSEDFSLKIKKINRQLEEITFTPIAVAQSTDLQLNQTVNHQTIIYVSQLLSEIQTAAHSLLNLLAEDVKTNIELDYWVEAFEQQSREVFDDLKIIMAESRLFNKIPTLLELVSEQSFSLNSDSTDTMPHSIENADSINEAEHTRAATTSASPLKPISNKSAIERLKVIDDLINRCEAFSKMDFEFLYDTSRDLLSIGYDVGERRRDPACYDLLASEARLASFILIARDQLPQKHWFSLGRLLTSYNGNVSLISWSGSMFEYLMPRLLMPSFDNTLLDQTCKAVVSRQIEYGKQRGVPWGISESCYNAADISQVYQYRAFGVPGLGFKRGLGDDLVIAPYASALSLLVMPQKACSNLQKLAGEGFLGKYGFYEAIDYTPSRVPRGKKYGVVRSFMAHHQGMSLLAFGHVLLNQPMQRRFMSVAYIKATELLLQERIPKQGATLHPHASEVSANDRPVIEVAPTLRVFKNPNTPNPEVHLLSNGKYHVVATNAGGGYSHWHGLAINRWREDATQDCWGTFIYLRDADTGRYWSTTHQPTLRKAEQYEAIFGQARAEYKLRNETIETHTEISVSPEDDVEIRRITLTNLSFRKRHIELTTYSEVVLASLNGDLAHRAFSNLFVQTEILEDRQAILCTRRKRTPDEKTPWMFHLFAAPGVSVGEPSFETDRAKFIGRGRTTINPIALENNHALSQSLSNTQGPVLDPIVAIRRLVSLLPNESLSIQIITGIAETREAALALVDKYCDRHFVERAFEMSWYQSQEVLRHINASEAEAQIYGRLASSIIYCNAMRRTSANTITRNHLGQSGLWRFGISGDLPIVLLRIGDINRIDLVKQVLQAHAYWKLNGLLVDLVIFNEDFSGYRAVLQDQIITLINAKCEANIIDKPAGVFMRRAEELSDEIRLLFLSVARVIITDTAGTLEEQLERRLVSERSPNQILERATDRILSIFEPMLQQPYENKALLPEHERIFFNGLGGFTADGREYVISLAPGESTPAPWANVIASPHIGTVVSESGGAYTWVENAHEFRLTTWHNDPVTDMSGEALYIRDEETGVFWSPTPLPARGSNGYITRHGFGYSAFVHDEVGISSELLTYVAMDAPIKFLVVKLRNHSGRSRKISLTSYWELALGEWRHANMMHIVTETDPHSGAIFARNAYSRQYAKRVVFAHTSERINSVTGNRTEFIGRNGSLNSPAAMRRKHLSGKTGAGLDPCASIQSTIELAEGQEREIVFTFGAANNQDEAQHYIRQYGGVTGARQALASVNEYWNRTLGAVQVETPDSALNVLTNGWLIYQTISCRLWARSGYYQSGGAYGFRDQLQDTMALIHTTPWLAREQIIKCAGRQFPQGDVQHWWHPPNGQGVRTHFSDDYLWLAYATCRYVTATGDTGLLDETIHFLESRELAVDEEAFYDEPQRASESATLYEHCVRAIKHGLRFGVHQLPLMGCGDWNDGMNLVGKTGRGESVWLAWFLYDNLNQFTVIARNKNDLSFAEICSNHALQLGQNIENNAWDGQWYRRAYFDDATPLGSSVNDECQIDSISQSWAVISGAGDKLRAKQAMLSVNQRLVKREANLIKLLDPPFDHSQLEPGYIKGYVPGVRENGGQYTHAAIWATMAFAMMGDKKNAWELYAMLNPINHGSTPEQSDNYKVEPYVMSADIYSAAPHTGRGGWTWYTGAAGWMYRLTLETLLGLTIEIDKLIIAPCMPDNWQCYKIHYRFHETVYHILIKQNQGLVDNHIQLKLDGVYIETVESEFSATEKPQCTIQLFNDLREHYVEVEVNHKVVDS